jgi:hypothetical protein
MRLPAAVRRAISLATGQAPVPCALARDTRAAAPRKDAADHSESARSLACG